MGKKVMNMNSNHYNYAVSRRGKRQSWCLQNSSSEDPLLAQTTKRNLIQLESDKSSNLSFCVDWRLSRLGEHCND